MNDLLHVALPEDLAQADASGRYRAASLDREGFLHCCDRTQLAGVLTRWFTPGQALVLLRIDADALDVPPTMEPVRLHGQEGEELFAHVYGTLATSAIVERLPFVAPDAPMRSWSR